MDDVICSVLHETKEVLKDSVRSNVWKTVTSRGRFSVVFHKKQFKRMKRIELFKNEFPHDKDIFWLFDPINVESMFYRVRHAAIIKWIDE